MKVFCAWNVLGRMLVFITFSYYTTYIAADETKKHKSTERHSLWLERRKKCKQCERKQLPRTKKSRRLKPAADKQQPCDFSRDKMKKWIEGIPAPDRWKKRMMAAGKNGKPEGFFLFLSRRPLVKNWNVDPTRRTPTTQRSRRRNSGTSKQLLWS